MVCMCSLVISNRDPGFQFITDSSLRKKPVCDLEDI